jgi:nucleoside-diphosphate-sugar epimerase
MPHRTIDPIRGKNVLITGASGTVGSALIQRLEGSGAHVHCQSRTAQEARGGETWLCFDLTDSKAGLEGTPEWDLVFHLAAQTSIAASRDEPARAVWDNVMGFIELLEILRRQDAAPTVVMAGTVTQVGLPDTSTIIEGLPDAPVTMYDTTKLAAELILKQYVRDGRVRGCCLRLATVYGATTDRQAADRGVIDKVMRQALEGRSIHVYGHGNYLRDYVHIDDVVNAFIAAAEHPEETTGRAFVIGTGKGVTIKEAFLAAVTLAESITGRQVPLEHVDPPAGLSPIDLRDAVVNSTAFRAATGWAPIYDLESGLRKSYG